MKRLYIVVLLALVSIVGAKAQFSISYSAGLGHYQMKDMKDLAKYSLSQVVESGLAPKGMKLVDNFPVYANHSVDLAYKLEQHEIGIKGTYMTTGATIAYADYSGKTKNKFTTNGYRIAVMYRYHFHEAAIGQHSYSIFGELSPGLTISKLKFKEKTEIYANTGTITDTEEVKFDNVTGFTIQPLAGVRFKLYNHILLTVSTGYDFEFGCKLPSSNFRIDWSGFRLNGGVGYSF